MVFSIVQFFFFFFCKKVSLSCLSLGTIGIFKPAIRIRYAIGIIYTTFVPARLWINKNHVAEGEEELWASTKRKYRLTIHS
jgi:hypothetical protein